ncbi:hypothetical protein B4168_4144 [Anoxybacillus flavithermus]|nr:hypothetical protein B4168_4144 [Anoxybacillus flavithermus]OAO86008.1 hypothetical protein GT23_2348 [Parageobacillus thermoglucosidasius]
MLKIASREKARCNSGFFFSNIQRQTDLPAILYSLLPVVISLHNIFII